MKILLYLIQYHFMQTLSGIVGSRVLDRFDDSAHVSMTTMTTTRQSMSALGLVVPSSSWTYTPQGPTKTETTSRIKRLSTAPELHQSLKQQQQPPRPYTEATDYMVYRHYFDPLEQIGIQRVSSLKPLNSVGRIEIIRTEKPGRITSKQRQIISSHEVKRALYRNIEAPQVDTSSSTSSRRPSEQSNSKISLL